MNDNYLCIGGLRLPLTEEQITLIRSSLPQIKLADVRVGEAFKIGGYEFIVLEHEEDFTKVLLKDILCKSAFSEKDCDFKNSNVLRILQDFENKISDIVGAENILAHTVDLTSNDGLKDYGHTVEKVSLLSCDMARKYVDILDKYKLDLYWWLVTPWSTPTHGYSEYVCCVSPRGYVCINYYDGDDDGVRPFLHFSSSIFVSLET